MYERDREMSNKVTNTEKKTNLICANDPKPAALQTSKLLLVIIQFSFFNLNFCATASYYQSVVKNRAPGLNPLVLLCFPRGRGSNPVLERFWMNNYDVKDIKVIHKLSHMQMIDIVFQ